MAREIEPVGKNKHGHEVHPAWGMIGVSRVSSTPGAVLFDSDVQHQHYVTVTIRTAARRRDLNRDWIYGQKQLIEVAMSEAQWASFVSSGNIGEGVPCTLLATEGNWNIPDMPYEPRLQESFDEVRNAGDRAIAEIREAFEKVQEKPTKANIRHLEAMIDNAPANMEFAAKSLSEHTENVVQRARADIEAMVVAKAEQLGIEPGDLDPFNTTIRPELTEGSQKPEAVCDRCGVHCGRHAIGESCSNNDGGKIVAVG